jgi:hypothetical protein
MKTKHVVLAALALALNLEASVRVKSFAAVQLGNMNELQCGSNMSCTKSAYGVATMDLDSTLVGMLQTQTDSTTVGLTSAACGTTILSNSADVVTLPEASTVLGCRITFICGTADDFDVNPADASDTISALNSVAAGTGAAIAPSAGDAIRCTDIGSSATLQAVGANLWAAVGVANGAWTDVN